MAMSGEKRKVLVIATGGTIAGEAKSRERAGTYAPGTLAVDALLAAVPELEKYATPETRQIASIGSEDMTDDVWIRLADELSAALAGPGFDGAVVLHGTDTLEETAYFLNLVLDTAKPVVFTGAMRPANAVSADGPMNIMGAVRLAADPAAGGRGVLVCLGRDIHAARDVTKIDSSSLDAFASPSAGPIGRLGDDGAVWRAHSLKRHTGASAFAGLRLSALPRVEVVYGHAGQRRDPIDAAVAAGARGVVHAGVGSGCVHREAKQALIESMAKGVAVVRSSRVARGWISPDPAFPGSVAAGDLNPAKSRALLQLALTKTRSADELQALFDSH